MRIFGYELKKFLNWKLLLILLLFSGLFYKMFISFYFVDAYRSSFGMNMIKANEILLQKYGPAISENERKDYEKNYIAGEKTRLNEKIAGLRDFRDAKITDVDQIETLLQMQDVTDDARKLYEKLTAELDGTGSSGSYGTPEFETGPYYLYLASKEEAEHLRLYPQQAEAMRENGFIYRDEPTVFPLSISSAWSGLTKYFSILILITAALLAAPYLVRERRSGVRGLAYTAKKGRKLFGTQLAAAAAAASLTVLAQFAVFFAAYLTGQHKVDVQFLGCFVGDDISSKTFGQLMLMSCLMMFFLALGFAFFSFAVSKFCRNYVALLAVEIPAVFLAGKLAPWLMQDPFRNSRIFVCAVCFLIPFAVCLYLARRETTADITE